MLAPRANNIMPELRRDPVTGRWVIIAGDRAKRPQDFIRQPVEIATHFCPFCPGNEANTPPEILAYRNGSERNTQGWSLRVVPNKFPALEVERDLDRQADGIYDRMNGTGAHEVIIESPEHAHTFATMPPQQIEKVLHAFRERVLDLRNDHRLKYAMIFKNHGEAAGATMEHGHSQLIALPVVPRAVVEELKGSRDYFLIKDRCIFCDITRQEIKDQVRMVQETAQFVVISPYAARFPFETWIVPRKHNSGFENAPPESFAELAAAIQSLAAKLDRVLDKPSYNMVLHTAPLRDQPTDHYHWHLEFIPKLTKAGGFEWGTGFYINPTSPEEAAKYLKAART